MIVREINATDHEQWLKMRRSLWPRCPISQHQSEIEGIQQTPDQWMIGVLDRGDGTLGGLIEVSLRESADGASTSPVAYVEGWYVDDDLRRQGAGRRLLIYAEEWAVTRGLSEIASDAELANTQSIAAHLACQFREVANIVQFIKRLK